MASMQTIAVGIVSALRGILGILGGLGILFMGASYGGAGGTGGFLVFFGVGSLVLGIGFALAAVGLFMTAWWADTVTAIVFGLDAGFRAVLILITGQLYLQTLAYIMLDIVIVGWSFRQSIGSQQASTSASDLSRFV